MEGAELVDSVLDVVHKAIFAATIKNEDEKELRRKVVVKFIQVYNARAHRLLAAAGRAPELFYCSEEDPDSEDFGDLIMVVMDYIRGKTAHQWYGGRRDKLLP